MVGPDSANEKTKLFDGENNLKVISKPPNPPLNNASPSSSSHQPDNIANGDNNAGTLIEIRRVRCRTTIEKIEWINRTDTRFIDTLYFSR